MGKRPVWANDFGFGGEEAIYSKDEFPVINIDQICYNNDNANLSGDYVLLSSHSYDGVGVYL